MHALRRGVKYVQLPVNQRCLNDTVKARLKCSNGTDLKWSVRVKSVDKFKGLSMYFALFLSFFLFITISFLILIICFNQNNLSTRLISVICMHFGHVNNIVAHVSLLDGQKCLLILILSSRGVKME